MEKLTREQVIEKLGKGEKNFSYLDLRGLNLSDLDLSNLDLESSNLAYCNLSDTNLSYTFLFNANLYNSKLLNTNLCCANLEYAVLEDTVLSNVDLTNTRLFNANLSGATLFDCNLGKTNLETVNLHNTRLDEKEKIRKGIILKESMIGYKKCLDRRCLNIIIVTLEIPKGAIVFSINNNKCRTNKAKVIEISNGETVAKSRYDENFIYEVGKEIEIEDFDLMYNVECSTGIHFFRTREEAENY